tara:strand:+ start:413 stop:766 length:354 start_codon:yes stop_codon:yes gene_type:complete
MRHDEIVREIERREAWNVTCPFPYYDREIIEDLKKLNMLKDSIIMNNEPITYCKTCLSIHIKTVEFQKSESGEERSVDYCVPCGNTELTEAHITEWEDLYEEKYGERFLTKSKSNDE